MNRLEAAEQDERMLREQCSTFTHLTWVLPIVRRLYDAMCVHGGALQCPERRKSFTEWCAPCRVRWAVDHPEEDRTKASGC